MYVRTSGKRYKKKERKRGNAALMGGLGSVGENGALKRRAKMARLVGAKVAQKWRELTL